MKLIWYVQGDPNAVGNWPNLFSTKETAESYARTVFPNESEDRRYARIFYREVFEKGNEL